RATCSARTAASSTGSTRFCSRSSPAITCRSLSCTSALRVHNQAMSTTATGTVRLAELVASLSFATDLGRGEPMEHCLRQTVIALRIADRLGLDEPDRAATYYTGLVASVYCHADAAEAAHWWGDDIEVKGSFYDHDLFAFLRMIGSGQSGLA